jgi:hypothetical protein
MRNQDFLNSLAALLAWREENGNGVNGMLGVLFVLRNRLKAGWSGGDIQAIMESHNQFSSMSVLGDGQTVHYPDVRQPDFQKILQYVDFVFDPDNPLADTLTNGALYYSDLNSSGFQKGGWFDRVIIGQPALHPRAAQIGTTTFFK